MFCIQRIRICNPILPSGWPSQNNDSYLACCILLLQKPVKYKAHFEFEELRKATDEEKKQYEQEEAEAEVEAAAAAVARAEARAAKEAEAANSG